MRLTRLVLPAALMLVVACGGADSRTATGNPLTGEGDPSNPGDPGAGNPADPSYSNNEGTVSCDEYAVQTSQVAPQILVVFDRSLSMLANGWPQAVSAIQSVTAEFEQDIDFGLMVFPDEAGFTCTAGDVDVPIKPHNAGAIQAFLSGLAPWGNTPTAAALKTAHATIGSGIVAPDQVVPPKYVVLITDGAPNCAAGGVDQAMVTDCISEISAMQKDDVQTYVLGYHIDDAAEKDALDRMAAAGGTGDKKHRDIGDQQALVTQFKQIVGAARSCDFQLDAPVSDPTFVSVKIDGEGQQLEDANGWQLGADMQSVSVQGEACQILRDGETHSIAVQVECVPIY
jgi:hypothetical protein